MHVVVNSVARTVRTYRIWMLHIVDMAFVSRDSRKDTNRRTGNPTWTPCQQHANSIP